MNVFHLEKDGIEHFRELFINRLHGLYEAERQLIKGGQGIALMIALMLFAAGGVYFIEQARINSFENHFQSQLAQRENTIQSIVTSQQAVQSQLTDVRGALSEALSSVSSLQDKLTVVTGERDDALSYVNLLQNKLTQVTYERDEALGQNKSFHGKFGLNP